MTKHGTAPISVVHAAFICPLPLFRLGEWANSKEERYVKEGQIEEVVGRDRRASSRFLEQSLRPPVTKLPQGTKNHENTLFLARRHLEHSFEVNTVV
jgi:hypothetical protein